MLLTLFSAFALQVHLRHMIGGPAMQNGDCLQDERIFKVWPPAGVSRPSLALQAARAAEDAVVRRPCCENPMLWPASHAVACR